MAGPAFPIASSVATFISRSWRPLTAGPPPAGFRASPLVHRGGSVGRWTVVAWDPQRFLAPYAKSFIDELVVYCRRHYPGREFARRVPALPKPEEAKG